VQAYIQAYFMTYIPSTGRLKVQYKFWQVAFNISFEVKFPFNALTILHSLADPDTGRLCGPSLTKSHGW